MNPSEKERNVGAIAGWSHIVPFALWLALMFALELFGGASAWKYALRSALCGGLLIYLRPWQWYAPIAWRNLWLAALAGVLVFAIWVWPESAWLARWPGLQEFYLKWAVLPWGELPAPVRDSPYEPARAGWALSLIRLGGSAFVIAVIEEFFWRGFLYRWMLRRDFLEVDPRQPVSWVLLLGLSLAFGLEHRQWLAGTLAGLVYLQLYRHTKDLWAAILAHVLTNLLLGLYVLKSGAYGFW